MILYHLNLNRYSTKLALLLEKYSRVYDYVKLSVDYHPIINSFKILDLKMI